MMAESNNCRLKCQRKIEEIVNSYPIEDLRLKFIKEKLRSFEDPIIIEYIEKPDNWENLKIFMTECLEKRINQINSLENSPAIAETKNNALTSNRGEWKVDVSPTQSRKKVKITKRSKNVSSGKSSSNNKDLMEEKDEDLGSTKQELIAKLKMYIHKCGVRKLWKKELEGCTDDQAINRLRGILRDLGVEGRPSLSKCQKIKEKLEYEKEMESINMTNILPEKRRRGISPSSTRTELRNSVSQGLTLDLSGLGDPDGDC